jgi:hypothetical protein
VRFSFFYFFFCGLPEEKIMSHLISVPRVRVEVDLALFMDYLGDARRAADSYESFSGQDALDSIGSAGQALLAMFKALEEAKQGPSEFCQVSPGDVEKIQQYIAMALQALAKLNKAEE